jgi:mandelamide amidase
VPAGIGGDTAGSIRIPASLCGVCGLRPTTGRWPGDAITLVPISNTRDTLGPLARSCADLELLDRVVTGSSPVGAAELRNVRLALVPHFLSDLDTGVEAATHEALAALKEAGVTLVEANPELIGLTTGSFDIMMFELIQNLTLYLNANTDGPLSLIDLVSKVKSPDVSGLAKSLMPKFGGKRVQESAYRAALKEREQLRAAYASFFAESGCDAIVFPATVQPATEIGHPASIEAYIHNTDAGSMAGIPGTAQPIGFSEGLPVSIALDGPVDSDRNLLSIAMAMEQEVFGRLKPPPL